LPTTQRRRPMFGGPQKELTSLGSEANTFFP
jgi:hypothetical protein